MKKRLFYTPGSPSMGNNCTFVSASLAFSAPYTFTSGITVLLTNGVTVFINLAGQSLSEAQIANVLNATPALNTLGIWFSSSAPSPPIVVNTYSQSSEIYVSRIIFDATVGTMSVATQSPFPISVTNPGGFANFENQIRITPVFAHGLWLYGNWSDVNQVTQYFVNEYLGEYIWTNDPLSPSLDPYARLNISNLIKSYGKPLYLDGNTGVDIQVTAGETLTIWAKLSVIL